MLFKELAMSGIIIFVIAGGIILLIPVLMYNMLVGRRNQVHNILGTMDALLKKRWDLIPNLAATVKGYADHERALFESVANARSKAQAGLLNDEEKVELENAFTRMVSVVRAVAENYPQLKAGENFLHLQRTLNELEEQISAARRAYNVSVTDYNNAVQMFPTNLLAGLFGFTEKPLFQIDQDQRQVPSAGAILGGHKA